MEGNAGAVGWEEPGWILVCRGRETPIHLRPLAPRLGTRHSRTGPDDGAHASVPARGVRGWRWRCAWGRGRAGAARDPNGQRRARAALLRCGLACAGLVCGFLFGWSWAELELASSCEPVRLVCSSQRESVGPRNCVSDPICQLEAVAIEIGLDL